MKLSSVGSPWMTGGTFGPEGGLPVLFVLLLGIAILLLLLHARRVRSSRALSLHA